METPILQFLGRVLGVQGCQISSIHTMVVSQNKGDPNIDPKILQSLLLGDRNGTLNLGTPLINMTYIGLFSVEAMLQTSLIEPVGEKMLH